MATMKDIARVAGVSHGTVSNVLNNRGNVSADKIKLVRKVAAELGYSLNAQAQQLRSSYALANTAAVILPNISEVRFASFYASLHKFFSQNEYNVLLFTTDESPYYEEKSIEAIISARARIVVSVSCFINSMMDYEPLLALGSAVLFVERKPPGDRGCFGFDYYEAGLNCGRRLNQRGYKNIGVLIGLDYYSNEKDFDRGVRQGFLRNDGVQRVVSTVSSSYITSLNSAFEVIGQTPFPEAVVCSNDDLCKSLIKACGTTLNGSSPHICTLSHNRNNVLQVSEKYYMSYSALGLQAAQLLCDAVKEEAELDGSAVVVAEGFKKEVFTPPYSPQKKTLNLLMCTSSSTTALMHIAPAFTKKTNIELNFVVLPLAELTDSLALMPYNDYFDIIRTNVTTTPGFPSDALTPLEEEYFNRVTATMLIKPVQFFSYIGAKPFAIPFDFSMYFQIYHKELFTDAILSRQFLDIYGRPLQVPRTYTEYNEVARFFTRSIMADSPVEFGTTAIINENTSVVYDFLRRYIGFGGRIVDDGGNFSFNKEKALTAVMSFMEMLKYSMISTDSTRKDIPIHNLLEGRTALEMATAAHTSQLVDIKKNRLGGRIDFAHLPAPWTSFGGGALAIPAKSKNKKEALEFIEWACGEDQAVLFASLGGLSPHKKIFLDSEILNIYPWYQVLYESADAPYIRNDLDYIDRYKFERLVGNTLRNTYHHVISTGEAANLLYENIKSCFLEEL